MNRKFMIILICVLSVSCMVFSACNTSKTASETVSAESSEPDNIESVELYANGELIKLDDEQKQEIILLGEYAMANTSTTLNTVITDKIFEDAKQNGVAVKVAVTYDKRKNVFMVVSDEYGAIVSRGSGSAKMMSGDVTTRLLQLAGIQTETPDTASSLEVTRNNEFMMAMMINGSGMSVNEKDIEPVYNIAEEIKKNDENMVKVILSSGYVNAVREQGTYLELYNQNNKEHITVYLPRGHQGVAVFNDKDAYNITDEIRNKFTKITDTYQTAEVHFEYDMLDENVGVGITYFTKDFRTDVNTKESLRNLLIEVMSEENVISEPDLTGIEGYDDIEKYSYEKGVTVTVQTADETFKAYFTQTIDDKKFDVVCSGNTYYKIDDEHLSHIANLLGITL